MNCVVFKLDERLHEKLIKFYKAYEIKTPPYAKFAAKNYDVTITLYEKGKVMFQGIGADIEASIWQSMQSKLTGKPVENTVKSKGNKKIGRLRKKSVFVDSKIVQNVETNLFKDPTSAESSKKQHVIDVMITIGSPSLTNDGSDSKAATLFSRTS